MFRNAFTAQTDKPVPHPLQGGRLTLSNGNPVLIIDRFRAQRMPALDFSRLCKTAAHSRSGDNQAIFGDVVNGMPKEIVQRGVLPVQLRHGVHRFAPAHDTGMHAGIEPDALRHGAFNANPLFRTAGRSGLENTPVSITDAAYTNRR